MFNLELTAHQFLQLSKFLIEAADDGEVSEAVELYHALVHLLEKKGK